MKSKIIIGLIIVFMIPGALGETYNHAGLSFTYSNQYQMNTLGSLNNVMLSQEWWPLRSVLGLSCTVIHVQAMPSNKVTPKEITKYHMESEFGTPIMASQVPTQVKGVYDALVTKYNVGSDNHVLIAWSEPNVTYLIISSTVPGWWQGANNPNGEIEVLTIANSIEYIDL